MAFAATVVVSGSPGPSRSLHRTSRTSCEWSDSRPRVLRLRPTGPRSIRSLSREIRLDPVCVVIVPTSRSDCSALPTLPTRSDGHPPSLVVRSVGRCLLRDSKDRPSTVSGAEEFASRADVAIVASEPGCRPSRAPPAWFCTTWTALLLDPARVLHRTSSHGVRDVSSPRQRLPITRSYPPKRCSSCAADTVGIAPLDAGPVSPSPVSRPGSPRTLPPRPWPLARPGPRGFPPLTKP